MRNSYQSRLVALGAIALLTLGVQSVHASVMELLNWAPVPDSVHPPFAEINYNGANLQTDVGAIGNGDGNLPPPNQIPGGLQVDTVVNAPIPFSFPSSIFTNGTGYYDVTLTFTGLAPLGAATQTLLPGPQFLDAQALGPGSFTLTSTAPAGPILLLQGTITNAVITGIDGGASGAVLDASGINYTGGAIAAALPANALLAGNDMSIAMTSVIPGFGIAPANQRLNAFTADATGSFDVNIVPEPASLSLLALAAATSLRRRRLSR